MKDTGEVLEIVYKNNVYEVDVRRTNKVPNLHRAKREKQHELVAIDVSDCGDCEGIRFAGVCMNTKCPSNAR